MVAESRGLAQRIPLRAVVILGRASRSLPAEGPMRPPREAAQPATTALRARRWAVPADGSRRYHLAPNQPPSFGDHRGRVNATTRPDARAESKPTRTRSVSHGDGHRDGPYRHT